MGYEAHPNLVTPPNDTVVWRYMDFSKFIDLLENSRLWFARADLLDDPREGDLTEAELKQIREAASPGVAEANIKAFRSLRREYFVNCWTIGSESMAMWDLYARGAGGIAIKSTVGSLKLAVDGAGAKILIAPVEYLDWRTASPWRNNVFSQYVRKDFGFRHESEIRMMIWDAGSSVPTDMEAGDLVRLHNSVRPVLVERTSVERRAWKKMFDAAWDDACRMRAKPGISVDVDVAELLDEVIVSPRSTYEKDLVEGVFQRRYGFRDKPVCPSKLSYRRDTSD
jgi:hypothetical protein